jgi:hypothetical protein
MWTRLILLKIRSHVVFECKLTFVSHKTLILRSIKLQNNQAWPCTTQADGEWIWRKDIWSARNAFRFVTPCTVLQVHRYRGPCCLHLQDEHRLHGATTHTGRLNNMQSQTDDLSRLHLRWYCIKKYFRHTAKQRISDQCYLCTWCLFPPPVSVSLSRCRQIGKGTP